MLKPTNSINVTEVDNELYIIAYNFNGSYQLCHILSGYNFDVNVTANIKPGTYSEPATLSGLSGALNKSYDVSIPSGTYQLIAVGIDWGGGRNAQLSVTNNAGTTTNYGSGGYQPGPFPGFPNGSVFWTNNEAPLTTITV